MKKISLFMCTSLIILCSCGKTIKIKTKTDDIKYIRPAECLMEKFIPAKYETKIINNYIAFDETNIKIFLENFQKYIFVFKKYITCLKNNENYYKNLH